MLNPSTIPASLTPRSGAHMTDELARRYLARVIVHARLMARRLPAHIALIDLISAGLLGVVEGFLRFDPDRSETLEAYLDHYIRGAILDELRRADPLTRGQRGFARQLGRAAQAANDPGAGDESLARTLGLSLAEFRSRVAHIQVAVTIQGSGCEERIADEAVGPDEEVAGRQEHRILASATGSLRPRERELLRLHYEEGQTFREIGIRFNVSESRVSQLHTHAIQNLRSILSA